MRSASTAQIYCMRCIWSANIAHAVGVDGAAPRARFPGAGPAIFTLAHRGRTTHPAGNAPRPGGSRWKLGFSFRLVCYGNNSNLLQSNLSEKTSSPLVSQIKGIQRKREANAGAWKRAGSCAPAPARPCAGAPCAASASFPSSTFRAWSGTPAVPLLPVGERGRRRHGAGGIKCGALALLPTAPRAATLLQTAGLLGR